MGRCLTLSESWSRRYSPTPGDRFQHLTLSQAVPSGWGGAAASFHTAPPSFSDPSQTCCCPKSAHCKVPCVVYPRSSARQNPTHPSRPPNHLLFETLLDSPLPLRLLRQYLPPLRGFRDPLSSAALGTLSYSSLADSLLPIPAPAQPRVPEGPALQCLSSSHPISRPWFPCEYIQLQTQPLSSQAALAAPNHHSIPLKQAQAPPGEAPSHHKGFLSSHTWLFGKCPTPAPLLPIQGNHVPSSGYLNCHRASVSASAKHGHLPPQEAVGRTEWDDITRRFAQALADPSCYSWWPSY